jgi:hypothetical protein
VRIYDQPSVNQLSAGEEVPERGEVQLRLNAELTRVLLPFYEVLGYQTMKRELVKPLQ